FQIEMVYRVSKASGHITELPITFVDRGRGVSKMSMRIVAEALVLTTWWGVRDRVVRRPPRRPFGLHLAPHPKPSPGDSSKVA
ncbi:MAG TPA: hypothetical protein VJ653_06370, partial [Acidimicrobiales bacterium]|nr:hypothetical protein [Acidimicrobiales bacterium]